jgi:hypothetical protein
MILDVSTPALLFPAISLLFLSYTNRFLHLSALIRKLHGDWMERGDCIARQQIENLSKRLVLIRFMQLLGAMSLLACVASMVSVMGAAQWLAVPAFWVALLFMGCSLASLVLEVWISGGALRILLSDMKERKS